MGEQAQKPFFWAGFHENISRHPSPFSCVFSGVNYALYLAGPTANRQKTQGPQPTGTKPKAHSQQAQKIRPTTNR